jgi:hypothetical protein
MMWTQAYQDALKPTLRRGARVFFVRGDREDDLHQSAVPSFGLCQLRPVPERADGILVFLFLAPRGKSCRSAPARSGELWRLHEISTLQRFLHLPGPRPLIHYIAAMSRQE